MSNLSSYNESLAEVGKLVLAFARVNRATFFEDGIRRESDTDHTVMLSICACALAENLYKGRLDIGKVAQFAIIHDLVEAYADDTNTFGITEEVKALKEKREHEAFLKIEGQFKTSFPWIPETIKEYESLATPEARFVKTVDKCMSKVTHLLNNGQYFKNAGFSEADMKKNYLVMADKVASSYGKEFPEIMEIMYNLIEEARRKTYE